MPESRLEALVTADVASGVRGLAEVAGTVDRLSTAVEASARTMVNQGRDAVGATASVRGLKDQVELLTRAEQEQVTTIRIADEQWAMLAATHRNRVNPAHEQTVGGLRNLEQAAKSTEAAVGKMGEAGGMAVSRMSGLAAMAGGGSGMLLGGAALVGGGLAFEAGKSAVENAEKQERALSSLRQAADVAGLSFAGLSQRTNEWIERNRAFVSNQFEAKEAMALFIRAGNDESTSLKAMETTLDLATLKNLGIKEAARMVELAMMGSGRAVRELGIDLKSLNSDTDVSETAIKELERAHAAVAKATTEHTNAARSLSEMQDALRGKTTLTQIEQDRLADKQNAVTKSAQNLATANAEVAKAQADVGTSASKSATILEELSGKVAKGRESTTELAQKQNELRNTWQSLSADSGPQLISIVNGVAGATDSYLRGLSGKSKEGAEGWKGINDAAVGFASTLSGVGRAITETGESHGRFSYAVLDSHGRIKAAVQATDLSIRNIKEAVAVANADRIEIKVNDAALEALKGKLQAIFNQQYNLQFSSEHRDMAGGASSSGGGGGGEVPYWGNGV